MNNETRDACHAFFFGRVNGSRYYVAALRAGVNKAEPGRLENRTRFSLLNIFFHLVSVVDQAVICLTEPLRGRDYSRFKGQRSTNTEVWLTTVQTKKHRFLR